MLHFKIEDFKPVAFYPYTSSVGDRILVIETWDDEPARRLKNACLAALLEQFNEAGIKCAADNKIVFQLSDDSGRMIYIGFYDFTVSVGLSVRTEHTNLLK